MYYITVHKGIVRVISLFYYVGLWRDKETIYRERIRKIFHIVSYVYFILSLLMSVFRSNNRDEATFLSVLTIICLVHLVRLCYFLWKQDEILELGTQITDNHEDYTRTISNHNVFMNIISWYLLLCYGLLFISIIFAWSQNEFPLNIHPFLFPLEWKSVKVFYYIAFAFFTYELFLCIVYASINTIIWYLMTSCSTKYRFLGSSLRSLGSNENNVAKRIIKQDLYHQKLKGLILYHQNLLKYIRGVLELTAKII